MKNIDCIIDGEQRCFNLSEHMRVLDKQMLVELLSDYMEARDYYLREVSNEKYNLKRRYEILFGNIKNTLNQHEIDSRDPKTGKPHFRATDTMAKAAAYTDTTYMAAKEHYHETLYTLYRLESAVELMQWKLEIHAG